MSFRRIRVSGALLNTFVRSLEVHGARLPDDARVSGIARADPAARFFTLVVPSREFPTIGEGDLISLAQATVKRERGRGIHGGQR
jgi:hypothetical protein